MKKLGFVAVLALASLGMQAEVKLAEVAPAGVTLDAAMVAAVQADLAAANLAYVLDMKSGLTGEANATGVTYATDKSADVKSFKTVGYLVYLVDKEGKASYVLTTMDAFTDDAKKIGVPTFASGAVFQQMVKNLTVKSNVEGVKNGEFAEGNIEFWPTNYGGQNAAQVPGASDKAFDFGDARNGAGDYGSMQVHNTAEKQTVFGYNCWKNRANADLGIGNAKSDNTDWTFSNAAKNWATATLFVFVK